MRESVSIGLTLSVGGSKHTIPGGNVRSVSLELASWGVEGEIEFLLQDDKKKGGKYQDKLLADFMKPDLGEVAIELGPGHLETKTKAADAAIATQGILVARSVEEEASDHLLDEPTVLFRRYHVKFCDPARALWRQHFPCALFTHKTFKDVIEAHKGAKISLTYDWDVISAEEPLISFCLPSGGRSSFYDLVLGYVRERGGVFTYDHKKGTYAITQAKDASKTAVVLLAEDVGRMISRFPEPVRSKPRILNCHSEAASTTVADNPDAAAGLFRDVLIRTPIPEQKDKCAAREKARPLLPLRQLEIVFRRFPTVAVSPSTLVDVSTKGGHSGDFISATGPFRVDTLAIHGRAMDDGPDASYGDATVDMSVEIAAELSCKDEKSVPLPDTIDPRFPWYIEGKVLSEVGEKTDITYDLATDQVTSVPLYRIRIPLFENQEIQVPYEPATGAGNLYLPLYKDQRVMVALDLHSARFDRLLDWRPEALAAKEAQGQQLFLGKSQKSNTSLCHDYEEDKPVFRMQRTNDKDTVMFRLEEGRLTLRVEEQKG